MSTVGDSVNQARQILDGGMADPITLLASAYTPGDVTIALNTTKRVGEGFVLSIGLTSFHVLNSDTTSPRVVAGFDGSPDLAHPAGSLVRVRPLFTDWSIYREVVGTVRELSSPSNGLYSVTSEEVSPDPIWGTIPLAADAIRVLRVRALESSSDDSWEDVPWTFQPNTPDGPVVRTRVTNRTLHIQYAIPFTEPTSTSDTLPSLGMSDHYQTMLAVGAARNLSLSMEARRAQPFSQGDPRRAEEVPVTAHLSIYDRLRARFRDLVADERARLLREHPYRAHIDDNREIVMRESM